MDDILHHLRSPKMLGFSCKYPQTLGFHAFPGQKPPSPSPKKRGEKGHPATSTPAPRLQPRRLEGLRRHQRQHPRVRQPQRGRGGRQAEVREHRAELADHLERREGNAVRGSPSCSFPGFPWFPPPPHFFGGISWWFLEVPGGGFLGGFPHF